MTTMADILAGAPADLTGEPEVAVEPLLPNALELARDAYTDSTSYFDASIRKQVEASLRQVQGVHPVGSKYHGDVYKTRSRLYRPKTRAAIRKNEAAAAEAFFSTRDAVAIEPEDDSNPLQRSAAAVMKFLVEYRLKHSIPWFMLLMGAYQDAQTVGICISHNYWHYDKRKKIDKPCIELLPVENFRFSPAASWVDPVGTSPYLIRMIPMYVKDVQARATPADGRPGWKPMTNEQLLVATQSGSDTTRQTRERGRQDSKDQTSTISKFTTVWVHENIVEMDGADYVYYTLGTVALLSDPVPLEEAYWHGERPFTVGCMAIETHKNYPEGIAGMTKDIAAEINHVVNLRLDNWAYALNKRYFVSRKAQADLRSLTRNVPGSATLMNDVEKDVKVLDTQDVTGNAFQEQDRLNLDFDDVAGAFSPSSVQSNRKLNETVGGLNLISTSSNQVGNYQLRTFVETWVQPTLRQLMRLEAFYEDDQRLLGLAAGAAKKDGVPIEAITAELMEQELMLSVDVGIGATNPQEKVNNFMTAMRSLKELLMDGVLERYGLDVQDVVAEIFGHLGYRDGKRFFDKVDDPTLAGMRAQLESLQQQLASKLPPPELLDAQVRNLDAKTDEVLAKKLEAIVRSVFASIQAAEVIAAVPSTAPLADKVMQMGGYRPPTPEGIDPNLPQPGAADPNVLVTDKGVISQKTGVGFQPGDVPAAGQAGGAAPGDTTPLTPATPAKPDTPGTGANAGITTMRPDSQGPTQ